MQDVPVRSGVSVILCNAVKCFECALGNKLCRQEPVWAAKGWIICEIRPVAGKRPS